MFANRRRRRNYNADIDETLFGSKGSRKGRKNRGSVISARRMKALTGDPLASNKDAIVLSGRELDSIIKSSTIVDSQATAKRHDEHERRRVIAARGAARKERMMQMERERKARQPALTETQQLNRDKRNNVLSHAKRAMDEEHDDVKHMNQMMLYAKCVTIRDAQIQEKKRLEAELAAEERRLDMAMEVERVRTLKMYEEREKVRQAEQKVGASVIIKQMQEREAARVRQQELREQDAQAMIQRIKELEQHEEEERRQKVIAGRKLLQEVMEANNSQARAKLRRKQEEIEEDLRIAEYLRQKDAREQELEEQAAKLKAEKEKEIARLRAMQEKAQDRQSQIDELRAKRYQEARDRQWRQQQMEIQRKKNKMKGEIAEARDRQRREKARRMAEQALQEREEYHRVLEWQREQNALDTQKRTAARHRREQHRLELLGQIATHEKEKALARQRFLEEGSVIKTQLQNDRRKLLRLKAEKLAQLKAEGVPLKYRAELAKKKVMVASIH